MLAACHKLDRAIDKTEADAVGLRKCRVFVRRRVSKRIIAHLLLLGLFLVPSGSHAQAVSSPVRGGACRHWRHFPM